MVIINSSKGCAVQHTLMMKKGLFLLAIILVLCSCSNGKAKNNLASNRFELHTNPYSTLEDHVSSLTYPRILSTSYTLDLSQRMFKSHFTCDDNKSIEAHPMYPSRSLSKTEIENQLLIGQADIGLIEVNFNEQPDFPQSLEYYLIGIEAPVFITSKHNPVDSLSTESMIEIFSSELTLNWAQYGGDDGEIQLLGHMGYPHGMELLEKTVAKGYTIRGDRFSKEQYDSLFAGYGYKKPLGASYSQSSDYVLDCAPFYCLSLGFPLDAGKAEKIKPILLNNVMPTNHNIITGEYPSIRTYAVIKKGSTKKNTVKAVVDWLCDDRKSFIKAHSGIGLIEGVDEDWLKIWDH